MEWLNFYGITVGYDESRYYSILHPDDPGSKTRYKYSQFAPASLQMTAMQMPLAEFEALVSQLLAASSEPPQDWNENVRQMQDCHIPELRKRHGLKNSSVFLMHVLASLNGKNSH